MEKTLDGLSSPIQYSARSIDLVGRTAIIDMMGMFSVKPGNGMGALFPDSAWLSDPDRFTLEDLQQFKNAGISVFHGGPSLGGYDNVF